MSGFWQKAGFSGEEMGQEHPATVLVRGQIIEGARGAGLCRLIVARSVAELPERDGWIYGLKFGYRALVLKDATRVGIRSRNDKDLTRMSPPGGSAALQLEADGVVIDVQGARPRIVHDHGSEFVNRDVAAVIKTYNLIDIRTKPRHPESNGIVDSRMKFETSVRGE
jgi:hypothetical protein